MTAVLSVRGVTRRFGGLQALTRVSFDVQVNEILGLVGPNGAGKTTLFNTVSGVYPPNEGRVEFLGRDVTNFRPYRLAHLGMARTHQIVQPLNDLSVRDNVMVGACFGRLHAGLVEAQRRAEAVMKLVGLAPRADMLAGSLNVAQKKRLELARAVAATPHLLLLDEVLAGLNPTEIAEMVGTIRAIRDQGITILMIEHVMHAVMNLSDRMIVLDFGEQIAQGTPAEIAQNPKVIEAYLGDPRLAEQLRIAP
jgi:branched-chain amino acid transport system ATP-binding protein